MALQAPQLIGWSKPLAEGVAHALVKESQRLGGSEARKGMPIDLGAYRVIVPSSFASRLIQENLAEEASGLLLP